MCAARAIAAGAGALGRLLPATRSFIPAWPSAGPPPAQAARHCSAATTPPLPTLSGQSDAQAAAAAPGALLGKRIGVIGAGQMAQAMIRSWLSAGVAPPESICTSDRAHVARRLAPLGLGAAFPEASAGGAAQVAAASDIIFLCVKPQDIPDVLAALDPHVRPHHLLVVHRWRGDPPHIREGPPRGTRVVRVMPNTPLLVGCGAAAYCLGRHARAEDEAAVAALLGASSTLVHVEEEKMDAVTALSGSGPAFVFMTIEALADGGVAAGLHRDQSLALAAQTVLGSAAMVLRAAGGEEGELTHPGVLKDRVASPAGTTIAGISVLEEAGLRGAMMRAVVAAAARSRQLSAEAEAETSA